MGCRCFEILGVDVMLDMKRKPYLIEVNHLPSFTCDSPLDEDIKRRLVDQTMDITCNSLSAKDKRSYDQLVKDRREATSAAASSPTALAAAATEHSANTAAAEEQKKGMESLMELAEYKDFERAYPPPDSGPKLVAQCEAILEKVREIFRPVGTRSRPSRAVAESSESNQPPVPQRPPPLPRPSVAPSSAYPSSSSSLAVPPRPPCNSTSAVPPRPVSSAEGHATASAPAAVRRIAASMANADRSADNDHGGRRSAASGLSGSDRIPSSACRAPSPAKKRSRSAPGPPRCALPPIARFSSPRLTRNLSATPDPSEQEGAAAPPRPGSIVRVPSRQRVYLPMKNAQILL